MGNLSSAGLAVFCPMILFTLLVILHANINAGVIPKVISSFPIHNFAEHSETFVIPIQSFIIILSWYTLLYLISCVLPHRIRLSLQFVYITYFLLKAFSILASYNTFNQHFLHFQWEFLQPSLSFPHKFTLKLLGHFSIVWGHYKYLIRC